MSQYDISIIIPILNEEALIRELFRRVNEVVTQPDLSYEVIVVSDGSTDQSVSLLKELRRTNQAWKIIELSRNFGHHNACAAGLEHATGEAVVFMDADLQDPPELIPQFIEMWRKGYEVVYGIKIKRNESFIWRLVFKTFYRVLNLFSAIEFPLDAGVFGLLDRKAADALRGIRERHRYLAGLRTWLGFRQIGIPYERSERYAGKRQQTVLKLIALALDAIFSFSYIPLRMSVLIGGLFAFFSFGMFGFVIYLKLFTDETIVGWTSILGFTAMTAGFILLTLGIIGEYLVRIYDEIKQRPLYIVKDSTGFDSKS